jgi:hypothetical protein
MKRELTNEDKTAGNSVHSIDGPHILHVDLCAGQ